MSNNTVLAPHFKGQEATNSTIRPAKRVDEAGAKKVRFVARASALGAAVATIFAVPAGLAVGMGAEWPTGFVHRTSWYATTVTTLAALSVVVIGALLGMVYGVISLVGHGPE